MEDFDFCPECLEEVPAEELEEFGGVCEECRMDIEE
jgi:hypothetical protein